MSTAAAAVLLVFCVVQCTARPLLKSWSSSRLRHGVRLPRTRFALGASTVDEWVLRNGGIIGGIKTEIMVNGGLVPASEREVLASRTIDQGEVVLAIPRQCILTKAKAEMTPLGRALLDRGEVLSNDGSYLTLLLCEALVSGRQNNQPHNQPPNPPQNGTPNKPPNEQRKGPPNGPPTGPNNTELFDIHQYIQSLPTLMEFRHLPLFWSDDDLHELKGSTVLAFLDIRKHSIEADYDLLCDCSSDFKNSVTEADFWWL